MAKFYDKEGNEITLTVEDVSKEIKDTIIKEAQGLVYANIDAKLAEIAGLTKNAGEKTSDYIARVIKEKSDKIEELSKESPDVAKLQGDITKLQELNVKLKGDLETATKGFDEKLNNEYLRSELNSLSIQVPAHLTEEEDKKAFIEDQRALLLSKFNQKYYVKSGAEGKRVVYNKETNEPVSDENLKVLPTSEIFKKDNGYLFREVKPVDPNNPDPGGSGKPSGKGGFKSFEEITAAATKAGHKEGGTEWSKFVQEKSTEAGIEI